MAESSRGPRRPQSPAEHDHVEPLPNQTPAVGEGTVPVFLTLLFAILPLWAIWYFLTHLAPLLSIEPQTLTRNAPAEVRAYRAAQAVPADAHVAQLARGAAVYVERCALCHGPDGEGQPAGQPYLQAKALRGDPLVQALSLPQLVELIDGGFPGAMPAWRDELGQDQILAVATFVQQVLAAAPAPVAVPTPSAAANAADTTVTKTGQPAGPTAVRQPGTAPANGGSP